MVLWASNLDDNEHREKKYQIMYKTIFFHDQWLNYISNGFRND